MSKVTRAALYLRVSTGEQTTDNQRLALTAEAERRGWRVVEVYEDAGISGAKGRDKRPAFDRLLKDATRGKFDVVVAWAVDRLGRSLSHLIGMLSELDAAHVDLYLHQQAIDTTAPAGKLFFHMLGAFAEFERDMTRSRIMAGMARARNQGRRIGRPRMSIRREGEIEAMLRTGRGIRATATALHVGVDKVQAIKKRMTAPGLTAPGSID